MNDYILTYSRIKFNPINPDINLINIEDIAHGLSNTCRFAGHSDFYSVAQHSVYVSQFCSKEYAAYGLLHDGSEAYLGDIPTPIKNSEYFSGYREIENKLQSLIYKKFNLNTEEPSFVKTVDRNILATEFATLFPDAYDNGERVSGNKYNFTFKPMPPKEAEKFFLDRFDYLGISEI